MICTDSTCTAHYGCRLRAKGIQLAPSATPSRVACREPVVRPMREPSWEGAPVVERRPGGYEMPVLAPGTTRPMTIKERADIGRAKVDASLTRLRTDPHVFTKE